MKKQGYNEIEELTDDQIKSLKRVSPSLHRKFKSGDTVHVLKDEKVFEVKKVGRPKKNPDEKENVVALRMSKKFIDLLKKRAKKKGIGWQTYAKKILEEHLGNP